MANINISALADLLKPKDEDSDSEDEIMKSTPSGTNKMGPGDVGAPQQKTSNAANVKPESKDIWDADEVNAGAEFEDVYDAREQPEYDIVYKQAVTSEDMFLQMGNKTPATSSCEYMVVKIKLPDAAVADVKLDVKDTFLDCRTPKYKLGLHLPHPVESKNSKAQWESKHHLLSVTLRVKREYDFMNF